MTPLVVTITVGLSVLAILMIGGLVKCLIDRRHRGAIRLDAGSNPGRRWHMTVAAMGLFLGLGGLAELAHGFAFFALALCAAGLLGLISAAMNAAGRLQICENGIWLYTDLIRWENFAGHRWDGPEPELILRVKTFRQVNSEVADLPSIEVPPEARDQIDQLLAKPDLTDR